MKKILFILFYIFTINLFAQTDHLNSDLFKNTADQILHIGNADSFGSGEHIVERSDADGTTVDSSAFVLSDSTAGTRAAGMFLLQEGDTIIASAADINLLLGFSDSSYTVVIDSTGWMVGVPRTIYGWSNDLEFSATDSNTVAWASGFIIFANQDTFAIDAGNTGNMGSLTFIYFDEDVSSTVLQTITTAGNAVGLGRIIVAVAKPSAWGKLANFNVFGNHGFSLVVGTTQITDNSITTDLILANTILAGDIAANTITGNEIAANTISTSEIIFGNMGDSLFWSINSDAAGLYINADKLIIGAATTFNAGYDIGDLSMVIYQISAPTTRGDGSALQNGDSWVDSTAAQGNVPKIWTGSEWRTAFTYINGGYIKTGTVDADRIDVSGVITAGSIIVTGDDISDLLNNANYKTVFTSQPTTPYYVGDLWTDGSDLWYCDTQRLTGAFVSGDWSLATDYDPDTDTGSMAIRKNAPAPTTRPPEGTGAALLDGDIWYNQTDGNLPWVYDSGWVRSYTNIDGGSIVTGTVAAARIDVSGVITAGSIIVGGDNLSDLTNDTNYKSVFTSTPTTPYYVGDLWTTTTTIKYCDTQRLTGAYVSGDWSEVADAYEADTRTIIIRKNAPAPTTRPPEGTGDALETGDMWYDGLDGELPHTYQSGTGWIRAYTNIDGGDIVTGTVDAARIFTQDMEVSGSGEIHSTDKDAYNDPTAGFWLGNDSGTWKFDIGDATENFKWDGSDLYINDAVIDDATQTDGTITAATIQTATGGVDKVVLDSDGLRIYDYSAGNAAKLMFWNEGLIAQRIYLDNYDLIFSSSHPQTAKYEMNAYIKLNGQASSLDILERASAPNNAAGYGKLWVKNDTSAPLMYTTDDDQDLNVAVVIERTTEPSTTWVGRVYINTTTNIIYMYAEGGWRAISSSW